MTDDRAFYHLGSRELQERFDSKRLADRLEAVRLRGEFNGDDRELIERLPFFFLATSDAQGRPDCSFKGGRPGFARVLDDGRLAFPDYDGNGMFRSLGNIRVNPSVGLLFVDFWGPEPRRLRVNGVAEVNDDPELIERFPGAQLVVTVTPRQVFPNCPRYIPRLETIAESVFPPAEGYRPPDPAWKSKPDLQPFLPRRGPGLEGGACG